MILIDREKALSHPFANGHYDHKNANRDFIRGFESYKEWLEDLPTITINEEKEPVVERWYSKDGTFAKGTIDIRNKKAEDDFTRTICLRPDKWNRCPTCGAKMERRADEYTIQGT